MAILKIRGSSKTTLTQKEIEKMLEKTAKGMATDIARQAEYQLKLYTKKNLYGQRLVNTKNSAYDPSGEFYNAINRNNAEKDGNMYFSDVGFDIEYLRSVSETPQFQITKHGNLRLIKFGRYTDVYGDFVGDELVEALWLEEGTGSRSIVPRRGAYMMRDTIDAVVAWCNGNGIDASIYREFGRVTISKEKR